MKYQVSERKAFPRPATEVLAAADELVTQLGGKRPRTSAGAGQVQADFNKAVGGTLFANRVQLVVRVLSDGADQCTTLVEAYPVDPLGQRLQFGVIGDPARLVTRAFWDRLEARLRPVAG